MSRTFKIINNYYDNYKLYKKSIVTINPGLTVLVGCNGIGKSTLLKQISEKLKKQNIPLIYFDNLHDGGSRALSKAGFLGNYSFMARAICSSEGENIVLNISNIACRLREFIHGGIDNSSEAKLHQAFSNILSDTKNTVNKSLNERWILLDAVDSGLSVDNIVDLKEQLFKTIFEDKPDDCDVYIVISANEYELARGENCFDVYNGKYIKFNDYEDYRQFILDNKNIKNNRG